MALVPKLKTEPGRMSGQKKRTIRVSDRALEMVMRDVLDGMIELSLETAFAESGSDFEIIEITARRKDIRSGTDTTAAGMESADILPFPPLRRAVG
jgi:hypothetical protein